MATNGPNTISIDEFMQFFEQNSAVPESDKKGFVLDYETKETVGKPNLQKYNDDEFTFTCVLTSKTLLRNAIKGKVIHADSTYKLTWENFPIHVFGTTDMKKEFHIIAIGISNSERATNFSFCFKSIKEGVLEIFEHDLKWTALMSDASKAIKKGFEEIHPTALKLTCRYHVNAAIRRHEGSTKINKELIIRDLKSLQEQSPDLQAFEIGFKVFADKWNEKNERKFITYIRKTWFTSENKYFFLGALNNAPSTNNALESTNGKLKDNFRLRKKLKMNVFKEKLMNMLEIISGEYLDGERKANWSVPISNDLWLKSYQWAKSNKTISEEENEEFRSVKYFIPAGEADKIKAADLRTYKSKNWTTFEGFIDNVSKIYTVHVNNADIDNATCTCVSYFKNYKCKHVLGIGLRLKLCKVPANIKTLEQKARQPGRPKRTGGALSRE